jgi:hypothetical protein
MPAGAECPRALAFTADNWLITSLALRSASIGSVDASVVAFLFVSKLIETNYRVAAGG